LRRYTKTRRRCSRKQTCCWWRVGLTTRQGFSQGLVSSDVKVKAAYITRTCALYSTGSPHYIPALLPIKLCAHFFIMLSTSAARSEPDPASTASREVPESTSTARQQKLLKQLREHFTEFSAMFTTITSLVSEIDHFRALIITTTNPELLNTFPAAMSVYTAEMGSLKVILSCKVRRQLLTACRQSL
jgi:hypothetical protein